MTKVLNVQRLRMKLNNLPKAAQDAIRRELAFAAGRIVISAKSFVPVDEGKLRDSIGWRFGEAPKGSFVIGRASVGPGLTVTVFAGNSEAFYARWVEFGTVKTSAQPFFFPAYRANKRSAVAAIRRAVNRSARTV